MKRKKLRLFAVLLMAVLMMTTAFSVPAGVYAAEKNEKVNIEVDSKNSDSITLKAEDGYVYAIQIADGDELIWKWAEEKQYTKDEKTQKTTVTFSDLEADEEYTFGKRLKTEDAAVEPITEKIRTNPEETTLTTKSTEGTTEPTTESTEPTTESTEPTTESTEPTTESTKSTESATESTEPTTESTKSTEPTTESTEPTTESTKSTEPATKATEPETETVKSTKPSDTEPPLNPEDKEPESAAVPEKMAETPVKKAATDTSIILNTAKTAPQEGHKIGYGRYISDTEIQWNEDGVFENLAPATEYQFVLGELKGNDVAAVSEPVTIKTLASAAAAPGTPGMAARTETTITLAAIENGEYGIALADAVAGGEAQISAQSEEDILWQESPEFTGLNPNTEYLFKVRIKYNAAEAMESLASESIMYKTLLPFEGSTVTGIAVDGAYVSGTKLTAAAVGNGMDNVNPAEGDSRWIPRTWNWGKDSFNQWKDGYTIPFTLVQVGNYRLSVDFEREEYTGGAWKATGVIGTVTIPFKVTEAPVTVYTITATAGANGTITPQGNVTVANGKDVEFTFKPNSGYKISKVYIDGYEVKVENNKYAFKSVNANHTVSVTFEQARKIDSPKTGDSINMTAAIGILIVSAILLAGIFVYSRKKK